MNPKVKWWLFSYYAPILLLIFAVFLVRFLFFSVRGKEDLNLLITVLGGLISFFYFIQKQQLEELKHFKELFNYFNEKYDRLNEKLNRIANGNPNKRLTKEEIDILYDYFNLCSEEYLYYRKGYIYPEVWKAWCNGMESFLQKKRIGDLWAAEDESTSASYYGLTRCEIQRRASR